MLQCAMSRMQSTTQMCTGPPGSDRINSVKGRAAVYDVKSESCSWLLHSAGSHNATVQEVPDMGEECNVLIMLPNQQFV